MVDLEHEFALAIDGVTPSLVGRLQRMGIPNQVLYGPRHHVGVARIATTSDGLFELHDSGELALIVPEGAPEVPGWDKIYDLIAFKPDRPGQWWRRRGDADLLGEANIASWKLSPLVIHATPLSWLRGGAAGLCVINWGFDPMAALAGAGHLQAETPAIKKRLERRIKEVALASFDISVMEEARHAA